MNAFDTEIAERLDSIRKAGLYRELRRVDSPQSIHLEWAGKTYLNFSSNDYLGLANHPQLKQAAIEAIGRYGAGAGASRLICGSLAPCHELEESLAAFKGTEAALSFSTGYAAALGAIGALVGKDDTIVIDRLVHACIVDAARLSGAKLRVYAHNDLNKLESILKSEDRRSKSTVQNPDLARRSPRPRVLIITESVFSMDGDHAPLKALVELKDKYGAWLMVDEAHATGLYGPNRRGLAEALDVADRIEVQMGTLGKAVGASGGYICGSRLLVDFLVNRARSFIFSTAPVPAAAAAAAAGVKLIQSAAGEEQRQLLWQRVAELPPWIIPNRSAPPSAIIPIMIGDEAQAVQTASRLREEGIFIPAIRFPTVARGAARLRVTVTAAHSSSDIVRLTNAATTEIRNPKSEIQTEAKV